MGKNDGTLKEWGTRLSGETTERIDVSALATAPALDPRLEDLPRAERTRALLEAAANSDSPTEREALEDRVIRDNMPIAAQIAARYRQRGIPPEDLEQVAYLALVKAVQRYEFAEDRDFLAFAVPTMRGEVRRYFRDLGWSIRPTRRIQDAQRRIAEAEGDLVQTLGRSPRPSEIARHLDLDLDLVTEALAANGCFQPSSLDTTPPQGDRSLADSLPDTEDGFGTVEARVMLKPLLENLTDRERVLLEMRFVRGATQAEIGEVLGITQMQVSRLLSSLLTRFRDQLMTSA
jgi:RNA polymerase sigma-B factor